MEWRSGLNEALLDVWAILMPVECAGCGVSDRGICVDCRSSLDAIVVRRSTPAGLPVMTALRYEGAVRRLILAFKEQNRTDVAHPLARPLAAALRALQPPPGVELVTIPSSRAAYRRRGYDTVGLLLRRAGLRNSRALVRHRRTVRQKTVSGAERSANVLGAFRARGSLVGRRFIIVDDVMTTGATLDEAARAIREGRGEALAAAAVAYTPRLGREA